MKHNIFTKLIEKSAFLFVLMSMSVLPVLTSCQMQISDDEVEYVDQSGMRPRDDSDKSLNDIGNWALDKGKSAARFLFNPTDPEGNEIKGYRSRVKNTADIQQIVKGYSGAISFVAGFVGSGDSYISGVGARALTKVANILDGLMNDFTFGLVGLLTDIFIPGTPSKEDMHFNAIMKQFAIQSSQIDRLSDQIANAKDEIIKTIKDNNLKDDIENRYKVIDTISNRVNKGFKIYLEKSNSGNFLDYEKYNQFMGEYSNGKLDFKAFDDILFISGAFDPKRVINNYKQYAMENSCWSWQYNQYMDYFYGMESTAFFKNYGIVEQLWAPYIYCGNDSNKEPTVVPNFNWELYVFLDWFHKYFKSDDSILKYVKSNFESHTSDNTFVIEISPEEYEENRKMYEEAKKNSALNIEPDSDRGVYKLQYDVSKSSAAERLWYILNYLSTEKAQLNEGSETVHVDGAGKFNKNFVKDFFAPNGIMTMGSTEDSSELSNIISSENYGHEATLYLIRRNKLYIAWQDFEKKASNYMKLLEGLKKIQDKVGTITCLKTGKVYAVQLGCYKDLQSNFFAVGQNYNKDYSYAFIRSTMEGYSGCEVPSGKPEYAAAPVAFIYDKIFHGMSASSGLTKLDSNIVENYKQEGMLDLNINRNSNTSRNGMLVYPSKADYEKIINFYNGRSVTKSDITFTLTTTKDGKSTGCWEAVKKTPKGKDGKVDENCVIAKPTLAQILLYDAGMGSDYTTCTMTETVTDSNGNKQENSYKGYSTRADGDENNLKYLMAEGLNPRASYSKLVPDGGKKKDMVVFENNMGFDSWDDWGFRCSIGYYAIKADRPLEVFFPKDFEYYNKDNFDNAPGVERIWTFSKSDRTLCVYSQFKAENPTLYFPVEVGDFDLSKL